MGNKQPNKDQRAFAVAEQKRENTHTKHQERDERLVCFDKLWPLDKHTDCLLPKTTTRERESIVFHYLAFHYEP